MKSQELIDSIFLAAILPDHRLTLLAIAADADDNGFVDSTISKIAFRLGRSPAQISFKLTAMSEMNAISRLVVKDDSVRLQMTVDRLTKLPPFEG